MILRRKSLLYDIENMAYTIADTGEYDRHTLHRVRDICQEGNIDRVTRVLDLAFSHILMLLQPVIHTPHFNPCLSDGLHGHDFTICFREDKFPGLHFTKEIRFRIKETAREFMVSMVLADWLAVTLPEAAGVWKSRTEGCVRILGEIVSEIMNSSFTGGLRRKLSPF